MPEGHTIHRVARDHSKRYIGQQLTVTSPQGRFKAGAKKLDGTTLENIEAFGKHLFYWWEGDRIVHIHLGLYGKFRNHRCPPPTPRGAVRLRVVGRSHAFDLNGPTACELISLTERDKIVARLGADPLRRDADVERVWQRISRSRASIGKLLLDQSVIAGVGNVYRAEALFVNRLNPERAGNALSGGIQADKALVSQVEVDVAVTRDAEEWAFEQEDSQGVSSMADQVWSNLREQMTSMLDNLDRREQFIIRSRYALGAHRKVRTFQYLADKLGVSKERVRQLEQRAVSKLRSMSAELDMDELFGAAMV